MLVRLAFAWLCPCAAAQPAPPAPVDEAVDVERGVASLGRLLSHPDPAVRDAAAEGLLALGPAVEFAYPALLDALRAGAGARETARALLERLGPRAAGLAPALASLGRSGEPGARELAVDLLGALSPCVRGAEGFLAESVTAGAEPLRRKAARALLIADPTRTAARDLLSAAVRDGTVERDVRLAAALGRAGIDSELAPWVVRALDDEQLANKRFAEEMLGHVDGRSAAAVPALLHALRSDLDSVRIAAADALGRIGSGAKGANDALVRLLAGGRAAEWFAAARALARIQPAHGATAARVLAALDDAAASLDDLAAVLAEFAPEVAARELGARLDRGDVAARLRAVDLAAALIDRAARQDEGGAGSAEELRALLNGAALAATGGQLLLRAIAAAEPAVRARALAAAAGTPSSPGRDAEIARAVLAALEDPDESVRKAALDASVRRPPAAASLAPALAKPRPGGDPALVVAEAGALSKALAASAAPGAAANGEARFTVDDLIEICVASSDFELSGFTLRDAEIDALLEAAAGADPVRARLAARALRRHDGPVTAAATARLVEALVAGPDPRRVAAADLLDARCGDGALAIAALVPALGGSAAVAAAAADSLISHGDPAARALAAALAGGPAELSRRALGTLAAMRGAARGAVPALVACAGGADPELARLAARALVAILTDGEIEARLQKLERGR